MLIAKKNRIIIVWILLIILIIIPSMIDMRGIITLNWPHQDKYLHLAIFSMFMLVTKLLFKQMSIIKVGVITFSLGLLIEFMQEFFTNGIRHFHADDILCNMMGIGVGIFIIVVYPGFKIEK